MTTTTYVATVAPFETAATEDSAPLARIRYVNDNHTFVRVTRVQHDALDQVAQRHVEVFREGLHHLQHPGLDADTGLRAFNCYHDNNITSSDGRRSSRDAPLGRP